VCVSRGTKKSRACPFFRSGFRGTRGKYTRQTSTEISIAVPREIYCGCDRMENSAVRVTGYRFCNTIDSCSIQSSAGAKRRVSVERSMGRFCGNACRARLSGKLGVLRAGKLHSRRDERARARGASCEFSIGTFVTPVERSTNSRGSAKRGNSGGLLPRVSTNTKVRSTDRSLCFSENARGAFRWRELFFISLSLSLSLHSCHLRSLKAVRRCARKTK